MNNRYETRGATTAIILGDKGEALIDTADLPRAMEFPGGWQLRPEKKNGKIYTNYVYGLYGGRNNLIRTKLHRWILRAPDGKLVDHKNRNGLDNTRKNLRLCSPLENQQNRDEYSGVARSGYRGVHWHKKLNKWMARCTFNKKAYRFGYFSDPEDAFCAVKEGRKKLMNKFKEESTNGSNNR